MMESLTVCVLGFGSIGSRVGKMLSAFGSRVLAVDDNALLSNGADAAYPSDQIEEAVASSDVVVCTLPLTEATRGLIDGGLISSMRDGVLLVNVSRACVVDEDAVWDALQRGKMGGFGSDVWWSAPKRGESASYPSEMHEFWKLDNVVMSPHRAGFVEDCLPHLDGAIENIVAVARGLELRGLVDVDKGY
jgi:phosphoglycerate dehydrogenase-like enzyme